MGVEFDLKPWSWRTFRDERGKEPDVIYEDIHGALREKCVGGVDQDCAAGVGLGGGYKCKWGCQCPTCTRLRSSEFQHQEWKLSPHIFFQRQNSFIINIDSRPITWLTSKRVLASTEAHSPCGLVNLAYFFLVVIVLGLFQEVLSFPRDI